MGRGGGRGGGGGGGGGGTGNVSSVWLPGNRRAGGIGAGYLIGDNGTHFFLGRKRWRKGVIGGKRGQLV